MKTMTLLIVRTRIVQGLLDQVHAGQADAVVVEELEAKDGTVFAAHVRKGSSH